jgi:hypothetical protein
METEPCSPHEGQSALEARSRRRLNWRAFISVPTALSFAAMRDILAQWPCRGPAQEGT